MIYAGIMLGCWLLFGAVWAVLFVRVKRDIRRPGSLLAAVGIRLVSVLAFILLLRLPATHRLIRLWFLTAPLALRVAGDVLCVAGVALSIWARVNLGANWSGQPSVKEGHELITSGAYRLVRHPIYSGMLTGALGTSLVIGVPGVLFLLGFVAVVISRIGVEERLMGQLFGDKYLLYRQRTKALIPHLL
jgi:protein-S-isoprenylcysteine O-methyltransferase Ste14